MVLNKWNSHIVEETDINHIISLKNIYFQTDIGLMSKGTYFYENNNKELGSKSLLNKHCLSSD